MRGTVKFFSAKRGYGFLIPDDPEQDGQEFFVHHSVIQGEGFRSLAAGEEVQFEVSKEAEPGKLVAINVTGPDGKEVKGSNNREPGQFGGKGKKGGGKDGKDRGKGKDVKGKGDGGKGKQMESYGKGKGASMGYDKGGWALERYDSPKGGKYGGYKGGKGYKGDYYDDYDYGGYGDDYGWGYKGDKGYKGSKGGYDYGGFKGKGSYKGGYKGYDFDDFGYDDYDYKGGYKGKGASKGGYKGPPSYKGDSGYGGNKGGYQGGKGDGYGKGKGKYDRDYY